VNFHIGKILAFIYTSFTTCIFSLLANAGRKISNLIFFFIWDNEQKGIFKKRIGFLKKRPPKKMMFLWYGNRLFQCKTVNFSLWIGKVFFLGGLKKKILDILQKFACDAFFFKSFTIKITFFCFIDLSNVGFVLVQKTLISFSVGRKILFLNCFFFFWSCLFFPQFFFT